MAIPEDADIDEWFQQEKERLSEKFFSNLQAGKKPEAERKAFSTAFKKLLAEYDARHRKADEARARHEKLSAPFKRFRAWRKQQGRDLKRWWTESKERYKAWRFQRTYDRLFPGEKRKI